MNYFFINDSQKKLINEMSCLTKAKTNELWEELYIRGTRIYIHIQFAGNYSAHHFCVWRLKSLKKNKKYRKSKMISIEEVLESPLISRKSKLELLMYLDIFQGKKIEN